MSGFSNCAEKSALTGEKPSPSRNSKREFRATSQNRATQKKGASNLPTKELGCNGGTAQTKQTIHHGVAKTRGNGRKRLYYYLEKPDQERLPKPHVSICIMGGEKKKEQTNGEVKKRDTMTHIGEKTLGGSVFHGGKNTIHLRSRCLAYHARGSRSD